MHHTPVLGRGPRPGSSLSQNGDQDGLIIVSIAIQAPNVNHSGSAWY